MEIGVIFLKNRVNFDGIFYAVGVGETGTL